jgi:hypothetical protein
LPAATNALSPKVWKKAFPQCSRIQTVEASKERFCPSEEAAKCMLDVERAGQRAQSPPKAVDNVGTALPVAKHWTTKLIDPVVAMVSQLFVAGWRPNSKRPLRREVGRRQCALCER